MSFDIKKGETVGIIGKNGAGKSTLLKVLSRITQPTKGRIEIDGRVASLLEVGTGFHPELSGRENIYLNGTILGMTRREIKAKFDEIIHFSGVENFVDTPVKHYSSGMYVRLAFAVAAHLEPEILIIDEVLAVGDAEFQRKCLGKMDEVAKEGKTVLFVSHNMTLTRSFCNKGILLNKGKVGLTGSMDEVIGRYDSHASVTEDHTWVNDTKDRNNRIAFIKSIQILDGNGKPRCELLNSDDVYLEFKVHVHQPHTLLKIGFDILRAHEIVFRSNQVDADPHINWEPNTNYTFTCKIPALLLHQGVYLIKPLLSLHGLENLTEVDSPVLALHIRLDNGRSVFHAVLDERNHPGAIFPFLHWRLQQDEQARSENFLSITSLR